MRACLSSNQQRTPRGTITPTEDAAALVGLNRMLLSRCFHMPLGDRFWLRLDRHCNRLRPVEVLRWALCFLEDTVSKLKAEAAYFVAEDGVRC